MAAPQNLKLDWQFDRPGILFSVAVPSAGDLICGTSEGKVCQLDPSQEKPEVADFTGHTSYVTGVTVAGDQMVSGSYDGHLIWWDRNSRKPRLKIKAHSRWIRDVISSRDGRFVISVADDMVCRIWEAREARLVQDLRGHSARTPHHFPSMLYACAISQDGELIATGDRTGKAHVWHRATGRRLATVECPIMYTWDGVQRIHSIGGIRSLAFSPDNQKLALGGIGKIGNIDHLDALARVEIFDWAKQERTQEFGGDTYKGLVERLEFSQDGSWLLAAGGDHAGFVQFYDLSQGEILKQDKVPMHVHDFQLDETRNELYAVGHGKIARWTL